MPLQNRVRPNGALTSDATRGMFMGNRGGRFHDAETRELSSPRHFVSKQWLCCQTSFNERHRSVMGDSYTELFFLDEVTALAAGHRPCFECRRKDFLAFAEHWRIAARLKKRPTAKQMDEVLHSQRLVDNQKGITRMFWERVPEGAVFALQGGFIARLGDVPLLWTPEGYRKPDFSAADLSGQLVNVLTPAAIRDVLRAGYQPQWHPSADQPVTS